MKRLLFIILISLSVVSARADERSQSVLRRVAEYVKTLGEYDARFSVVAGEYRTTGQYCVAGDAYHIVVDRAEVYSDGKSRYEVDHDRKEVNIDEMDIENRNILDNPTRCFDFVGDDYASMVWTEMGENITLLLKANDTALEGEIYLTVNRNNGRPNRIVYVLYEDQIEVDITSLERRKGAVPKFDASKYKGYEIVDFR